MELNIRDNVLIGVKGEGELTVPDGVEKIGPNACGYNSKITAVHIPSSVKEIASGAFFRCSQIASVCFSEGLVSVGDKAFYGCTALKRVDLPQSLAHIGSMAFLYSGILNVVVPQTVKTLAADSFHASVYPMFTNDTMENFFGKVRGNLKSDCVVCLKKGELEKYTATPWGEEIYLPYGVEKIGNTAFDGKIVTRGFSRWQVKKIYVPTSVVKIGKNTFIKCKDVTICAKGGSYAEKYAKMHGILFEETDYL